MQWRHIVSSNIHVGLFTNILAGVLANDPLIFSVRIYNEGAMDLSPHEL